MASTEPLDELLTLDELCTWLKVNKTTICKQRSEGTGPPGYRISKHLRFKRGEVLTWLHKKKDSVWGGSFRLSPQSPAAV